MVRSTTEIAQEIKKLEAESALAFELEKEEKAREAARKASVEIAERSDRRAAEAEMNTALAKRAIAEREDAKREWQQLQDTWAYLENVLPAPDTMPRCPQCGARLGFWPVGESPRPPEVFAKSDYPNHQPYGVVLLHCPNGCSPTLARFQNQQFRLSFK
jgi:hypothetical protein